MTLGLMLPGLLAVAIYQFTSALEQFEVPGILGLPATIYVFSTKIYSVLHASSSMPAYGEANALAMLYLLIAIAALGSMPSRDRQIRALHGHHRQRLSPATAALGRWRWPAFGLVLLFLALRDHPPSWCSAMYPSCLSCRRRRRLRFRMMTVDHYVECSIRRIGRYDEYFIHGRDYFTLTVASSFLVSLVMVRSKFWGRRILDQMAFMPHAIPGIVMGLAFLWVFLQRQAWH